MELVEAGTHSFVVKMWLEETVDEAGCARWRGHITHVPDGERRYVNSPREVTEYITSRLRGVGADPSGADAGRRARAARARGRFYSWLRSAGRYGE